MTGAMKVQSRLVFKYEVTPDPHPRHGVHLSQIRIPYSLHLEVF